MAAVLKIRWGADIRRVRINSATLAAAREAVEKAWEPVALGPEVALFLENASGEQHLLTEELWRNAFQEASSPTDAPPVVRLCIERMAAAPAAPEAPAPAPAGGPEQFFIGGPVEPALVEPA
eukprot:CAMPEP_0180794074 /NCGR_PEP_ID=MMETSP1038_2-20121128/55387_1 /TAXON_ID=632150 /ORGANISM="Azadinium spinosum, Strain 3D9" /LENGTH=121 /DNA_ID=CAMNT_0022832733 /DNA_START=26 /DNA_END=387 /DNA_ORIENTATION=+